MNRFCRCCLRSCFCLILCNRPRPNCCPKNSSLSTNQSRRWSSAPPPLAPRGWANCCSRRKWAVRWSRTASRSLLRPQKPPLDEEIASFRGSRSRYRWIGSMSWSCSPGTKEKLCRTELTLDTGNLPKEIQGWWWRSQRHSHRSHLCNRGCLGVLNSLWFVGGTILPSGWLADSWSRYLRLRQRRNSYCRSFPGCWLDWLSPIVSSRCWGPSLLAGWLPGEAHQSYPLFPPLLSHRAI